MYYSFIHEGIYSWRYHLLMKVSKNWCWMPQTGLATMTLYLPRLLQTALMNSYRPFPTWLIFRSVVVRSFSWHSERGFSETKVKESQHGFDKEKLRNGPSAISHSFQRSLKRQLHYKSLITCHSIRCFQNFNQPTANITVRKLLYCACAMTYSSAWTNNKSHY